MKAGLPSTVFVKIGKRYWQYIKKIKSSETRSGMKSEAPLNVIPSSILIAKKRLASKAGNQDLP